MASDSRSLIPFEPHPRPLTQPVHQTSFGPTAGSDEVDLRRALRTLWRRKFSVLATIVLITGIAGVLVFRITPTYRAETLLVIGPQKANLTSIQTLIPDASLDLLQVQTEVETLQAEGLTIDVVERLGLSTDPEFVEPQSSSQLISRLKGLFPGGSEAGANVLPAGAQPYLKKSAIAAVRSRVSIRPGGRSYMISVRFVSQDPAKAALIANTYAETYIRRQLDAKRETARAANTFLKMRLEGLRERMLASQLTVEKFRAESGIVSTLSFAGRTTLTNQRVAEINSQLVGARVEHDSLVARRRFVEARLASGGGASSAAAVLRSPLVQKLREEEALLLRAEADLATTYGDRHPRMIEVRAQLRDLQTKIEVETARIVQGLRNETNIARARVVSLESSLHGLIAQMADEDQTQIRLGELGRQAEADREIYQAFLTRFKETAEQVDFQQPDARIVSKASVPLFPAAPKKWRTIFLAFFASTMIGVLVAIVGDKFKRGVHTAEEVERWGAQVIGVVPDVKKGWQIWSRGRSSAIERALDDPFSAYAEAMQRLRTVLHFTNPTKRPKVVLFASALGGEGKSTVSRSFAEVAAKSGQKTIHVNCDLRQPDTALRRKFGSYEPSGLVDVLEGEYVPDSSIVTDPETGCHFLGPGVGATKSPLDLLRSGAMRALLIRLSIDYELIVLDSPPILPVSDALVLSRLADVTIYLVRWGHTPVEAALAGLKEIASSTGSVAGVILTRANLRKARGFGQAAHGTYYGLYDEQGSGQRWYERLGDRALRRN